MIERTDIDGRWESPDNGTTWLLVAPSQTWLDARAADPDPEPIPSTLDLLAQMPVDELRRVLELGVAITEPEAVDALTAAVTEDDPTSGVAVVAQAAEAAATPVAPVEP